MIRVIVTIVVIINSWLLNVKFWITSHLGRNPKNGGNPPKDRRLINRENFNGFEEKNTLKSWFKWNNLNIWKKYTRLNVKNEYIRK